MSDVCVFSRYLINVQSVGGIRYLLPMQSLGSDLPFLEVLPDETDETGMGTPLLKLAKTAGFGNSWKTVRGVELLIEQGCRQFERWTGRRAPASIIRDNVLGAYDG